MKFFQTIKEIVLTNWLVLFLLLILSFSSNLFLDPTQPIKFILLGVLCLFGNIWILKSNQKGISFKKDVNTFLSIFLLFVLINISSLFSINNIITGLYETFKLCLFFNFTIIALFHFKTAKVLRLKSLSNSLSLFQYMAFIALLISFYENTSFFKLFENKIYGGLFINPNQNSQLLLLSIPLVLIGLKKTYSKANQYFKFIGIILSIVTIIILNSKTVLISGLISIGLGFLIYSYLNFNKKKLVSLITFLSISFAVVFFWHNKDQISNLHSIKHRNELWSRTAQLIKEKPLFGAGIGNWKIENLNYVPTEEIEKGIHPEISGMYAADGATSYKRPHNDFLWVFSELGILGILSYASLFGYLFYISIKSIQNSHKGKSWDRILLLLGLLSYFIISQLSFPKERIEQSIILFITAAIILSMEKKDEKSPIKNSFFFISIIIAITSIGYGTVRSFADYNMKMVKQDRFNHRWSSMIYHLNKINSNFYPFASDGQPIKLYRGIAELNLGNTEDAYKSLLDAKELNSNQLFTLSNLGTYHFKMQHSDSALFYFNKALSLNPNFEDAILNKVAIFYNQGQFEKAWNQIHKIPLTSKNTVRRDFLNLFLEEKSKDSLLQHANKKYNPEKVKRYFQSHKYRMFYLYLESIQHNSNLNDEFDKSFDNFN